MSEENSADTVATGETAAQLAPRGPFREIAQPFIDFARAPRALWGLNFSYMLEGMVYFGVVTYLAMYFNQYVGLTDHAAGIMVGILTSGITISMFFFGGLADRWGVRIALIIALSLMLAGRLILAGAPTFGLPADGLWSATYWVAMAGILFVVLGYGMYQPAAYATVRQVTTAKTAAMGYAMLYALMNLGGWFPTFFGPIRRTIGIHGAYWVYSSFTVLALVSIVVIMSRRSIERAVAAAKAAQQKEGAPKEEADDAKAAEAPRPALIWKDQKGFFLDRWIDAAWHWIANHPLTNPKFAFFIFSLIPVQTLFAHNWLTLPMYVARAYRGSWVGKYFEIATNFNPILIFLFVPIVTALTSKRKVYHMMIVGTFVMAAPTFLLAVGPTVWSLFGYLVIMTIGEAMWQPRFLQYAAEIAPEGRTGAYMGVAQFPWFLTKVVTSLYSGRFLARYCPQEGALNTERMWLIYACIAMCSTVLLIVAYNWLGRDFKTKAA